jgi:DNA-binding CsgD family transcriptional regulator
MREADIERATDACYEAVTAPEAWPDALQQFAWSVDASCAMLYPKDVGKAAVSVPASRDYQPFLEEYVAKNWFDNHYRADRGWPLMARRGVVIEHDLATDEERRKIPVYNDLYLRWGYPGFAAIGFSVGANRWCVPFLRSTRQGFFSREEAERIAGFRQHMRRWVSLSERFEIARLTAGIEALEKVGCAAMLVGPTGHVDAMNAKAESLLGKVPQSLLVKGGHLHAADQASDHRLRTLITAALAPEAGTSRGEDVRPILVEQPERRPLVVEAVSVSGIVSAISTKARTILLVTDLGEKRSPRVERLCATFGFTAAEARLAAALTAGENLRAAAQANSIAYETARVRLKSIFEKTGVQRQAELVGMLTRTR